MTTEKTPKKLADLKEELVKGKSIGPMELDYLDSFADKFSKALQSTPANMLRRINVELNKFGYAIDTDVEITSVINMPIYFANNKEVVDNAYVKLKAEHQFAAGQYDLRADTALSYKVELTFERGSLEDLAGIELVSAADLEESKAFGVTALYELNGKKYKVVYAIAAESSVRAAEIAHAKISKLGADPQKIVVKKNWLMAEETSEEDVVAEEKQSVEWKIIYKKANGGSYIGYVHATSRKEAIENAKTIYKLDTNGGFVRSASKAKKNVFESVEDTQEGFTQGPEDKKRFEYRLRHPDIKGINQGHIMAKSKATALEKLKKAWPEASLVSIDIVNESVEDLEEGKDAVYTIIKDRKGKETEVRGTLSYLIDYHKYTLETGKSYEGEKGNRKININPRTIRDLVNNLNNAVDNAAANGHSDTAYTIQESVEDLQELSKGTLASYAKKASRDASSLKTYASDNHRDSFDRSISHERRETYDKRATTYYNKAAKRAKGVDKAVDKLAQETKTYKVFYHAGNNPNNDKTTTVDATSVEAATAKAKKSLGDKYTVTHVSLVK